MVTLIQLVNNLSQEIAYLLSSCFGQLTCLNLYLRIISTRLVNILFILTQFTILTVAIIEQLTTACKVQFIYQALVLFIYLCIRKRFYSCRSQHI